MRRVYLQFSKKKKSKYLVEFPQMKRSDINAKVSKEWKELDIVVKEHLKTMIIQNKVLRLADFALTAEYIKVEQQRKAAYQIAKRAALTPPFRIPTAIQRIPTVIQRISRISAAVHMPCSSSKRKETSNRKEKEKQTANHRRKVKPIIKKKSQISYKKFCQLKRDRIKARNPNFKDKSITLLVNRLWKFHKKHRQNMKMIYRRRKNEVNELNEDSPERTKDQQIF